MSAFIGLDGRCLKLLTELPRLFVKCIYFLSVSQKINERQQHPEDLKIKQSVPCYIEVDVYFIL